MTVQSTKRNDVVVVSLQGRMDSRTAGHLRKEAASIVGMAERIVLDLSGVSYLSSAGMRLLLLLYRYFLANSARCVLMGISDELVRLMSHTGFLGFFKVVSTKEEALQLLS